jgi:hypothetical protein
MRKVTKGRAHFTMWSYSISGTLFNIDWLIVYGLRPAQEFFTERHHCRWRAAKFRPMLGAQGLWQGVQPNLLCSVWNQYQICCFRRGNQFSTCRTLLILEISFNKKSIERKPHSMFSSWILHRVLIRLLQNTCRMKHIEKCISNKTSLLLIQTHCFDTKYLIIV